MTIASAVVVVRGKPARSKKSLAATPLRSTPYTLCPHAASHSMSTALPHSGTDTRLESSGGDVTPRPGASFYASWALGASREVETDAAVAPALVPVVHRRRVRIRVDGSLFSIPRRALLDDSGGAEGRFGRMSGSRGVGRDSCVFVAAGPVATDPDKDAKTRANPRVSKVPLASEMPAAAPAAAPTATEATTAELGQRVAPWESLANGSVRCFRPSRGTRVSIAHGGSRPPLLSVASGANRRRRALPSACPSLTIDAAGSAGYRREPSARRPPRAAQSVPPPPVFSTSPDASGDGGAEPLLGSSVAVAVGGART